MFGGRAIAMQMMTEIVPKGATRTANSPTGARFRSRGACAWR